MRYATLSRHIFYISITPFAEKFGNRDYMLTISHVTMDHDAEFSVVARNVAGTAKSSAQLLVEPKESSEFRGFVP